MRGMFYALALAAVSACSHDASYVMPEECIAPHVDVQIEFQELPTPVFQALFGKNNVGYWHTFPNGNRRVFLDSSLSAQHKYKVIEHETCHEIMFLVYGNGEWH